MQRATHSARVVHAERTTHVVLLDIVWVPTFVGMTLRKYRSTPLHRHRGRSGAPSRNRKRRLRYFTQTLCWQSSHLAMTERS